MTTEDLIDKSDVEVELDGSSAITQLLRTEGAWCIAWPTTASGLDAPWEAIQFLPLSDRDIDRMVLSTDGTKYISQVCLRKVGGIRQRK